MFKKLTDAFQKEQKSFSRFARKTPITHISMVMMVMSGSVVALATGAPLVVAGILVAGYSVSASGEMLYRSKKAEKNLPKK